MIKTRKCTEFASFGICLPVVCSAKPVSTRLPALTETSVSGSIPRIYLDTFLPEERALKSAQTKFVFSERWRSTNDERHRSCEQVWRDWIEPMKKLILAVAVCALYVVSTSAQLSPGARKGLWRAQWITAPDTAQRDAVVLYFRKIIHLERVPEHFVVQVSADNQFILSANQREVGRGPARVTSPIGNTKPTISHPFLHAGRNELAATVWNFGVSTPACSDHRSHGISTARRNGFRKRLRIRMQVGKWKRKKEYAFCRILLNFSGTTTSPSLRSTHRRRLLRLGSGTMQHVRGESGRVPFRLEMRSSAERCCRTSTGNLCRTRCPPCKWRSSLSDESCAAPELSYSARLSAESRWKFRAHATVTLLLDHSQLTTAYPELTLSHGAKSAVAPYRTRRPWSMRREKKAIETTLQENISWVSAMNSCRTERSRRRFVPLGWRTWRYLQLDITDRR